MKKIDLIQLPDLYAIFKIRISDPLPKWLEFSNIFSITRDDIETTILYNQKDVLDIDDVDRDWVLFRISGVFDFDECGIVLSVIKPLSQNGIGIFLLSTFSSDLLLLKESDVIMAKNHLVKAGHKVQLI